MIAENCGAIFFNRDTLRRSQLRVRYTHVKSRSLQSNTDTWKLKQLRIWKRCLIVSSCIHPTRQPLSAFFAIVRDERPYTHKYIYT